MEWLRRLLAHRRLGRGRCRDCGKVLRDDQRAFCSDDCQASWTDATAW